MLSLGKVRFGDVGNFLCYVLISVSLCLLEKIIRKVELLVGDLCCLNIDPLWPVEIPEFSGTGFVVKMFWFLPPGSPGFVFHRVV